MWQIIEKFFSYYPKHEKTYAEWLEEQDRLASTIDPTLGLSERKDDDSDDKTS